MKSIAALNRHKRIEHVEDARHLGKGVIVTLQKGWSWGTGDEARVRGFAMVPEALQAVRQDPLAY